MYDSLVLNIYWTEWQLRLKLLVGCHYNGHLFFDDSKQWFDFKVKYTSILILTRIVCHKPDDHIAPCGHSNRVLEGRVNLVQSWHLATQPIVLGPGGVAAAPRGTVYVGVDPDVAFGDGVYFRVAHLHHVEVVTMKVDGMRAGWNPLISVWC